MWQKVTAERIESGTCITVGPNGMTAKKFYIFDDIVCIVVLTVAADMELRSYGLRVVSSKSHSKTGLCLVPASISRSPLEAPHSSPFYSLLQLLIGGTVKSNSRYSINHSYSLHSLYRQFAPNLL